MKLTTPLQAVRLLPLVLFVWLYASSHLFVHAHRVGDVWVVHSHAGQHNHQHQGASLQTILFLSHFDSAGSIGQMSLPGTTDCLVLLRALPETRNCFCAGIHVSLLRAPPAA